MEQDSVLQWLRKQAEEPVKQAPETFAGVFTKTALDRGCTQEQIDRLLKEIDGRHA